MPTFTHVFYGLAVLIPILFFAREKFSYKLAFIFLVNNIFGPDLAFLFGFIDPGIHSIIGFVITAIPLSLVFSYTSRFSMEKVEGKKWLRVKDDHIREVNWVNAFFATAAGGISHFFIDQFFHWEQEMKLLPNLYIDTNTMLGWSGDLYHTMNPIMVIGEFIVVAVLLLSPFFLRKGYKESLIVFISASILSLLLMLLVSTEVYGGEREYAGMFCVFIYIFIPYFLLAIAARNILDHPPTEEDKRKLTPKQRLLIVSIVSTLVGIVMLAYGLITLLATDMIYDLVKDMMDVTPGQLQGLAIYYGFFGLLLFLGSVGLFFKLKIARIFAIIGSGYFIIFGFPIGIACFLFEDDIKVLFEKKQES